jgi:iron complex outermembrane receptor protein
VIDREGVKKAGVGRWMMGASFAVIALALPTQAQAQAAQTADMTAQASGEGEVADIVVTGFRQSLGAAINLKRESVGSVDAIVAEDIAKFPDQNLAESLQRVGNRRDIDRWRQFQP